MGTYNLEEYTKISKLKLSDTENIYDFLAEYNLYSNNYDQWKNNYKSKVSLRSYTTDDLVEASHYRDLKTSTGKSDSELLNLRYNYDEFNRKYAEVKKDSKDTANDSKDNNVISEEKLRIQKQIESKEFSREDSFSIGTVFLSIPPSQISVSDERQNFRFDTLRSVGETILSSGRSTTRVDLDIVFNGLDDINNKLRPLLAQYKTTPFLPIKNSYLENILTPFNIQYNSESSNKDTIVEDLVKVSSESKTAENDITGILKRLQDRGYISQESMMTLVESYFKNPSEIPPSSIADEDIRVKPNNEKTVSFATLLRKEINVNNSDEKSLVALERDISKLDGLQSSLEDLSTQSSRLRKECLQERMLNKPIVGVLSQLSISTVPDFPETLACRISLYIFNYEPFSEDFAFIADGGEDRWTQNVWECSLFIDWYARRFLSETEDNKKLNLKKVAGDSKTTIAYIENISPVDDNEDSTDSVATDEMEIGDGLEISGISISFKNIIQFLPILSHKNPTCQYLGSYNTDVSINMFATNISKVNEFSKMIEKTGGASRTNNNITRNNFILIKNELLQFCGMRYFAINSFNIDTVPENPGLYSLSIMLSEYKLETREAQKLKRQGITSDEEIKKAARWMLDKSHKYAANGRFSGQYAEYGYYYKTLSNQNDGWLYGSNKENNLIISHWNEWNQGYRDWKKLSEAQQGIEKSALSNKSPANTTNLSPSGRSSIVKDYSLDFIDSFNGKDDGLLFNNSLDSIAGVLAIEHEDDIKKMILNETEHPLLVQHLENSRDADSPLRRSYCYPDLELPKYSDITNGLYLKNTYKKSGMGGKQDRQPLQSDWSDVDPDFFMYKRYLWEQIDGDTNLHKAIKRSMDTFEKMLHSNKNYKEKKAPSEKDIAKKLENKDIQLIPEDIDSKEKFINDAEAYVGPLMKLKKVVDRYVVGKVVFGMLIAKVVNENLKKNTAKRQEVMGQPVSTKEDQTESVIGISKIATAGDDRSIDDSQITNITKTYSYDRLSKEHLGTIAKRIRDQQKDNDLRMVRAFPTFKLYFIEEDSEEWGLYDDPYEYGAINSIDIIKSRKEAADTAVISLLNTYGVLDSSDYGLYDEATKNRKKGPTESFDIDKQETALEQRIDQFILKPGTRIQIKMGYSSDPNLLDIVFNGMVAEVSTGDTMNIVAQGYGVELLTPTSKDNYTEFRVAMFKILDKAVKSPHLLHFGRWEWLGKFTSQQKVAGLRKKVEAGFLNKDLSNFHWESWHRNLPAFRHLYELRNDPKDDNIYHPEQTYLYNIFGGAKGTFIAQGKTVWDVFQDMTRRMPGYISAVLPFDYRATIYFGPADGTYYYTNRKNRIYKEFDFDTRTSTPEEKINELSMVRGKYEIVPQQNLRKNANILGSHLTDIYNSTSDKKIKKNIESVVSSISGGTSFLQASSENAINFLDTTALSNLNSKNENDLTKINAVKFISNSLASGKNLDFKGSVKGNTISIQYESNENRYSDSNGKIYTETELVNDYNAVRTEEYNRDQYRKLVRTYHYKDSVHHIIANNIVASDQYMYNKATVRYGSDSEWVNSKRKGQLGPAETVSAQADDDIWPEKIKEQKISERNAHDITLAWLYSLSNLWLGMREMYVGGLTLLGDPSIKPYDFVFMNDFFNDMYGPVEVEQVTHHFSRDTGFVTTIVPDLVCYVNNILSKGATLVAGSYSDALSRRMDNLRVLENIPLGKMSPFRLGHMLPFSSGTMWPFRSIQKVPELWARLIFSLSALSVDRREPISFTPLLYAGRPYIAGIEGFRKDTLVEAIDGFVQRFDLRNRDTVKYIKSRWTLFTRKLSDWWSRK